MKILLIVPNIKSYDVMPCLSVATLKGYINGATKHKAKVIDLVYHRKVWKQYLSDIIYEENPDLIGISVLSFNYPEALEIARFIKNNFDIKIIFGGVHVILTPEEVIQNKEIDIICLGEGEHVLKDILDNSLNCKDVKGIWYKKNDKIIKNEKRKLIENLDSIPFPDFDDFNIERYFIVNHKHFPIMGSRGCPYNCTFCGNHALKKNLVGKYVRFRSVENILDEVEQRIKQFFNRGLRYFYFFDDTFILYKDFVLEFCNKYKKKGLHKKVKWTANVRANLVTEEIIKAMKDAGCYEVRMGVESGNDYIRNTVYNRNMTQDHLINSFKIIKKHGLTLRLDFILGAPFETVDMMEESLELAKLSGGDRIFFAKLYPFPGTEIKKICENEHTIDGIDFDNKGMPSVDKTSFVTNKQLKNFSKKIRKWQARRYIKKGFELNGLGFIWDIFIFLLYYKGKYDFEYSQIYRWNVQRYLLIKPLN
jgi:radical SAM superfamily enzyme YgiQ (UPF0313 family)